MANDPQFCRNYSRVYIISLGFKRHLRLDLGCLPHRSRRRTSKQRVAHQVRVEARIISRTGKVRFGKVEQVCV